MTVQSSFERAIQNGAGEPEKYPKIQPATWRAMTIIRPQAKTTQSQTAIKTGF